MLGIQSRKFYDQAIWKNGNEIISVPEQKGSGIKRFRRPKQRDGNKTLCKWLKQQKNDNGPFSGLLMLLSVVFKF